MNVGGSQPGFPHSHDEEEVARRLRMALGTVNALNPASGMGKLIGCGVLLFMLAIFGFVGYSVFKTVTAVNESIREALQGVPDIDEIVGSPVLDEQPGEGGEKPGGGAPDPRSQACAQELAGYTDALLASDGESDGGLETKYGKRSFESRTVQRAYTHVLERLEAGTDGAVAVNEAADIIVSACEKKLSKD